MVEEMQAVGFGLAIAIAAFIIQADARGPGEAAIHEPKTRTAAAEASLPVGPTLPVMPGYRLRMRKLELVPGAAVRFDAPAAGAPAYFVVSNRDVVSYKNVRAARLASGRVTLQGFDPARSEDQPQSDGRADGRDEVLFLVDLVPVDVAH